MIRSRTSFKGARAAAGGNWWEAGGATGAVAVYQPKGAASLVASYVDLSGNGNDALPIVAPTLDASGWVFSGTQYLDSGVVPANDQTWSMIVRFSGISTNSMLGGCYGGSDASRISIQVNTGPANNVTYSNGGQISVAPAIAEGNLAFAGEIAYRNGVAEAGTISPEGGTNANSAYIGARHDTGGPILMMTGKIQAWALYDNTLTAEKIAAVYAAMAAL